ncbi:protein rtoA-like [Microplitis mediator]|uniref:protein rtoA-like n=1 Tax=Microplitis mediator TaxID=375433 RepID=UPI002554EE1E|nr:protein rtoA-like [Microplitis mediator]
MKLNLLFLLVAALVISSQCKPLETEPYTPQNPSQDGPAPNNGHHKVDLRFGSRSAPPFTQDNPNYGFQGSFSGFRSDWESSGAGNSNWGSPGSGNSGWGSTGSGYSGWGSTGSGNSGWGSTGSGYSGWGSTGSRYPSWE